MPGYWSGKPGETLEIELLVLPLIQGMAMHFSSSITALAWGYLSVILKAFEIKKLALFY